MSKENQKQQNAHKHGIYSTTAILPGEDPVEFDKLYSALVEEWTPTGATEEDAVRSIARAIWRKRRVQKFLEIELAQNTLDPKHPSYDEALSLMGLVRIMRSNPETAFEYEASRWLRPDAVVHLQ